MYKNNQPLRVHVLKIIIALYVLAVLLPPANSWAQTNPQRIYVGVTFIKVRPGKQEQYMQLVEKYGKKINEYFYKNQNLLGWYLYRILMPSGSTVDYDFATVNVVPTLSTLLDPPGNQKEFLKKVFPEMSDKAIGDLMGRYDSVRTIVRREIYTPVEGVETGDSMNATPSKYMEVDMMHPAPGRTDAYIKMEKDTFRLLHAERIKAGVLKSWGLYERAFADESTGFEYVTVNFFDNLDKLGEGYADALKKAFPQANMNNLFASTMATRTMIRSEIWKLIYYVDRSNTKK